MDSNDIAMAEVTDDKCYEILRDWLQFCDQTEKPDPEAKERLLLNVIDCGSMAAMSFYDNNQYEEALKGFNLLYKQRSEILEPSHPDVKDACRSIGLALGKLGKFNEAFEKFNDIHDSLLYQNNLAVDLLEKGMCDIALDFLTKVHEKASKLLGSDHAETLIYKHNISRPLKGLWRFQEALKVLEEVYEVRKKTLGDSHLHTLISLRDIGMCLYNLNKREEAIDKLNEAYDIAKKELKPDDPQVLLILDDMAFVLTEQARYEDARELYGDILELQRKDPTSKNFLTTKTNIGVLHMKEGNYKEASKTFDEVRQTLTKIKADECRIYDAWNKIADVHAAEGDYASALTLYKRIYDVRKQFWSCADQRTLSAQYDIGRMYAKLGEYDKALEVLKDVSSKRKSLLGMENSDIQHTSMLMAEIYAKQQKYEKAIEVYEELYKIYEHVNLIPGMMTVLTNIASMLCLMGKYEDSLEKYKEIKELRKDELDFVDTLGTEKDITCVLWKEGLNKDLLSSYEKLHKKSEEIVGAHDIITIDILNTVATIYSSQKEHEKAINAFNKVYEFYKDMPDVGLSNRFALFNRSCVAKSLYCQSKFDEALDIYRDVHHNLVLTQGEDSEDSIDVKKNIDTVLEKKAEASAKSKEIKNEVNVEATAQSDCVDNVESEGTMSMDIGSDEGPINEEKKI